MMPSLSVVHTEPSRRRNDAPARLLAAEADRAVEQARDEPLEADRHLDELRPSQPATRSIIEEDTSVLPIAASGRPVRPRAAVEVVDRDREVVVGVHQPAVGGDDAVPVGVGVVAGGDVVVVLALDQRGHRVRRGAVHPDLAVPVQRHEPPRRVDQRVDHGQVEAVPLGDLAPVVDARAAERVGADARRRPPGSRRGRRTSGRSST